jgi:3-phenylpropionate/trans-cinnamate dioxygenase ferredoxin reductase component
VDRDAQVVVVGAGLAGARTVEELRAQGHQGPVLLLGAEPHLPYDRPPLSKDLLAGRSDDPTLDVPYDRLDVEVRTGVRATGLRPGCVSTDAGEVPYDGLVLATGARARELPGAPGAVTLRTVDDARALRRRLVPGARVVVIGAGWIGAEVSTAAAAAGCRVTAVEVAGAPLSGALGEQVGAATTAWWSAHGVDLRLGEAVAAVEPDRVVLGSGESVAADVVVVGIGARPDTGWLEGSGLPLDDGVAVDEHLAAGWPDVVAVGDCAAWTSLRYGRRLRVQHWDDALRAPAVAVATLLGRDEVHDPVPYFWSDQFGHVLQHVGIADGADALVLRGEPGAADGWTVCWLQAGRLVALLAVDRPRDLVQGRRLVAAGTVPDPERLADPAVPLRSA